MPKTPNPKRVRPPTVPVPPPLLASEENPPPSGAVRSFRAVLRPARSLLVGDCVLLARGTTALVAECETIYIRTTYGADTPLIAIRLVRGPSLSLYRTLGEYTLFPLSRIYTTLRVGETRGHYAR